MQISAWQEDVKALNKEMKQHLIIQNVKVKLVNGHRYKVNSVVEYNIQKSVDEEAQHLIAQDIESAYRSRDILKKQLKTKNTNSIKRFMKLKFIKFIFIQRFRLKFELKRWKKYYKKPLI